MTEIEEVDSIGEQPTFAVRIAGRAAGFVRREGAKWLALNRRRRVITPTPLARRRDAIAALGHLRGAA